MGCSVSNNSRAELVDQKEDNELARLNCLFSPTNHGGRRDHMRSQASSIGTQGATSKQQHGYHGGSLVEDLHAASCVASRGEEVKTGGQRELVHWCVGGGVSFLIQQ